METLNVKYYSGQTIIINSCGSIEEEDVFVSFFRNLGETGLRNIKDAFISFSYGSYTLAENGCLFPALMEMIDC